MNRQNRIGSPNHHVWYFNILHVSRLPVESSQPLPKEDMWGESRTFKFSFMLVKEHLILLFLEDREGEALGPWLSWPRFGMLNYPVWAVIRDSSGPPAGGTLQVKSTQPRSQSFLVTLCMCWKYSIKTCWFCIGSLLLWNHYLQIGCAKECPSAIVVFVAYSHYRPQSTSVCM